LSRAGNGQASRIIRAHRLTSNPFFGDSLTIHTNGTADEVKVHFHPSIARCAGEHLSSLFILIESDCQTSSGAHRTFETGLTGFAGLTGRIFRQAL
jgi:hypothetical protein